MIDNQNGDFHSFSSFTQLGYMLKRLAQQDSYIKANAVQGEKGDTGEQGLECYYIYSSDNLTQNFNIPFSDFNRTPVAGENFICFSVDNNTNISYISKCNIVSISGENAVCSIIEKSAINSTALPSGGKTGEFLRKKSDTNYDVIWKEINFSKFEEIYGTKITVKGSGCSVTFNNLVNIDKIFNMRMIIATNDNKVLFLSSYLKGGSAIYFTGQSSDNKFVSYMFNGMSHDFIYIDIEDSGWSDNGDYSAANLPNIVTADRVMFIYDEIKY